MNPRSLLLDTARLFRKNGILDPETDAALLLSSLTGLAPLSLRLNSDMALDDAVLTKYQALVARRLQRVPVQYILGETYFCGRRFQVDARVLIPRPETELLCEWALDLLRNASSPRILDLCCGSGCIGLTLKAERPDAAVTLSDISSDALAVASINAQALSLDVALCQRDLLDHFTESSMDLIISNPPYIPSEECSMLQPEVLKEPLLALDGGTDGCDLYRRIIHSARSVLSPGGLLLMETGIHESFRLSSLLLAEGYTYVETRKDYGRIDRMILAVSP